MGESFDLEEDDVDLTIGVWSEVDAMKSLRWISEAFYGSNDRDRGVTSSTSAANGQGHESDTDAKR